ncbi:MULTISPECIES: hypothetical protein [Pseudofrankia]|uniref:hypothetical protein n=1 Tax=Pseudofrankia TaxID=2994363 RepID=UPI000234D15C|nr:MULTISPECIES: hypothetical protein [Pseudofrankia]
MYAADRAPPAAFLRNGAAAGYPDGGDGVVDGMGGAEVAGPVMPTTTIVARVTGEHPVGAVVRVSVSAPGIGVGSRPMSTLASRAGAVAGRVGTVLSDSVSAVPLVAEALATVWIVVWPAEAVLGAV